MTPQPSNTLNRSLGLWQLVLFGLAYTAPLVVLMTFGILDRASQGTVAGAYLMATIAIFFTAASYGRMATMHATAGSAYTYSRQAIAAPIGFMVGWSVMLDYFLLPMLTALLTSIYLAASFPDVPKWVFVVTFLVVTTGINGIGIRLASTVNGLLLLVQGIVLLAFLALAIRYVVAIQGAASLESVTPFFKADVPLSATAYGASLAALSFLGFDAVSTLSEEARRPARDVPRAVLLVAVLAGLLFVAASFMAQLVEGDMPVGDPSSAGLALASKVGGDLFSTVFIIGLVITQIGAGISAQAGVARLLYAMGRDGVLPQRVFAYVHERTRTPLFNIVLAGIVGLLALFLSEEAGTSLINFGAFVAFTAVNCSVVAMFLRSRAAGEPRSALTWLLFPAIGAASTLWLLFSLSGDAKTLGLIWMAAGLAYLVWLTRGFRRPTPDLRED